MQVVCVTHQDDSVVARGLDERAEPLTGLLIVLLPRRGDGVSWNGRKEEGDMSTSLENLVRGLVYFMCGSSQIFLM